MKGSLLLAVVLALTGCASLQQAPSQHLSSSDASLRECAEWYRTLDARAQKAKVRDVQEARLSGFPYLRVNRHLASYRGIAAQDEDRLKVLVARMQSLDLTARQAEIANAMPVYDQAQVDEDMERTRRCADSMRTADLADPATQSAILQRSEVPDAYSRTQRVFGVYALTRVPFGMGVKKHQGEVLAAYQRELVTPADAHLVQLSPPVTDSSAAAPAAPMTYAAANALNIPDVPSAELERLYAVHAPEFEIEDTGAHDRAGALQWASDAKVPVVNPNKPVVYRRAAWTRYGEHTLLQLVYTVWFSERPPASSRDLLAGLLDGVTWRVTLAPDGEPLLYDTIHPCGCYHMFFPTPRATARTDPDGGIEFMFSPQSLPRIQPGERLRLRIATRTHYLERVSVVASTPGSAHYEFAEQEALRSLPRPDGRRASLYGQDGLVAGTERPERLLFWPMGISSAGAMRQWGHHATAFVGRRHFDDADLLEKRFQLTLP